MYRRVVQNRLKLQVHEIFAGHLVDCYVNGVAFDFKVV